MDKQIPILYSNKRDCCGCGACMNICPKGAISMQEDEAGFVYPHIDETLCIRCGRCKSVCAFQNCPEQNQPRTTYAAIAKNKTMRENSASGGVFSALAQKILREGGVVAGAAMGNDFSVKHIFVDSEKDLVQLQGSKYTHSSTEHTFETAQKLLKAGKKVLYSGTPCQIAGLKGYLGKDYENLITVDLVCHGVPSNRMFKDYIDCLGKTYGGTVSEFKFRDKRIGWGINGSANVSGKKIKIWQSASSYLFYFTRCWLYRENCYCCKYACSHRPADLTIGDFWGIEKQHPEFLGKGNWEENRGISVLIVNTEKGENLLSETEDSLDLRVSSFEKAAADNGQLRQPSSKGKRDEIIKLYCDKGWTALEKRFQKNIGLYKYSSQIKALLPSGLKRFLKSKRKN